MDKLNPEYQRYLDITRESSLNYWNSLLSVNGIFITVFSAVVILEKTNIVPMLLIILSSVISCWLLIQNFEKITKLYEKLGSLFQNINEEEQKEENDLTEVIKDRKIIKRNIRWVKKLLIFQIVLIIFTLLSIENISHKFNESNKYLINATNHKHCNKNY